MGNASCKMKKEDIIVTALRDNYKFEELSFKMAKINNWNRTVLKKRLIFPCDVCCKIYNSKHDHDCYENHRLKKKYQLCIHCNNIQLWNGNKCKRCRRSFGKNHCKKCNIITNEDIYHCEKCGVCNVGKKSEMFHCNKCNRCVNIKLKKIHICQDLRKENCYFCLDPLIQTGINGEALTFSRCGHSVHKECFDEYMKSINNCKRKAECGVCRKKIY